MRIFACNLTLGLQILLMINEKRELVTIDMGKTEALSRF